MSPSVKVAPSTSCRATVPVAYSIFDPSDLKKQKCWGTGLPKFEGTGGLEARIQLCLDLACVSRGYTAVLQDMIERDEKVDNVCFRDTLELLWCYHIGPFASIDRIAQKVMDQIRNKFEPGCKEVQSYNAAARDMRVAFGELENQLYLCQTAKTNSHEADQYKSQLYPGYFKDVTAATVLELMLHFLREVESLNSLAQYVDMIRGCTFSNVMRKAQSRKGFPAVYFICIGNPSVHNSHVIATCKDDWGSYVQMQKWRGEARENRFKSEKEGALERLLNDFKTFYDKVKHEERGLRPYISAAPTEEEKIALWGAKARLRGPIVDLFASGNKAYHHERETASPFTFPECNYYPRCHRCQAFFQYSLPDQTIALEAKDMRLSLGCTANHSGDLTTCAEVMAMCLCQKAISDHDKG